MTPNIASRGQVFTPDRIVQLMLGLRQRTGRALEPSAGDGAFSRHLGPDCIAIELDSEIAPAGAWVMNFFAFPVAARFETVIGNPPYVRCPDIEPATRALLESEFFDDRSNLYLHFIEKTVRHLVPGGELIFIVPRDFIKLTSARRLNTWLHAEGTITHWLETGDQAIFAGAAPNCAIFRYELGNLTHRTQYQTLGDAAWQERRFTETAGQLSFLADNTDCSVALADLFAVKVGAVSGADPIFTHPDGNAEFVCSRTRDTGATRRMIYNVPHPDLLPHKESLLARRIRRFTDDNWWQWGRGYHVSAAPRIYVNGKTRRPQPFFQHPATAYDGSVLALFPKNPGLDLARAVALLNEVPWDELGFVVDGRYMFSQRSLENAYLPEAFRHLQ